MHGVGLEPTRFSAGDLKSPSLTSSDIRANKREVLFSSLTYNTMERRKSLNEFLTYLRSVRPPGEEYLLFDRLVRHMLAWFDIQKIRQPEPFFKQEGKEYEGFKNMLVSYLGEDILQYLTPEFVQKIYEYGRASR